MQQQLINLPPERERAPFDTNYGQREFHAIDPNVFLISYGETLV